MYGVTPQSSSDIFFINFFTETLPIINKKVTNSHVCNKHFQICKPV